VDIPSRRAASGALRSSAAIFTSERTIEAKFTVQPGDFVLDLGDDCKVVTISQGLPSVLVALRTPIILVAEGMEKGR
jgi:hypothetical protein